VTSVATHGLGTRLPFRFPAQLRAVLVAIHGILACVVCCSLFGKQPAAKVVLARNEVVQLIILLQR
jgi:hypothetical protein